MPVTLLSKTAYLEVYPSFIFCRHGFSSIAPTWYVALSLNGSSKQQLWSHCVHLTVDMIIRDLYELVQIRWSNDNASQLLFYFSPI